MYRFLFKKQKLGTWEVHAMLYRFLLIQNHYVWLILLGNLCKYKTPGFEFKKKNCIV